MGRGSFEVRRPTGRRAALAILIAAIGAASGCQPLYGGKPEKPPAVVRKKAPPAEVVVDVPVKEIEECQADFRGDNKRVNIQAKLARDLIIQGTDAVVAADRTPDPMASALKVRDGIDKFRNALTKDPYSIDATLQLALAYDRVYRKGCAILMLKRLATLSGHPDFAKQANAAIDSIGDNGQWFKRYRKDAMSAAGR
jgi:hypothetical protein